MDEQVALVTGASRGIGAATARRLARDGRAVAINSHPDGRMVALAEDVAAGIRADGGVAGVYPADVSDAAAVASMFDRCEDELGRVSVLVSNAMVTRRAVWSDITDADWDHIMAVNLRGAFLCSRRAFGDGRAADLGGAPALGAPPGAAPRSALGAAPGSGPGSALGSGPGSAPGADLGLAPGSASGAGPGAGRGGALITISSVLARVGAADSVPYATTKAGLIGFTRSMARALGPAGVRVNSVLPGAIRTEEELEAFPDQEANTREALAKQAIQRRGVADDIAGVVSFLAGPDSAFMTGQTVCVDGGWVLH